jgi:hypothetical protein
MIAVAMAIVVVVVAVVIVCFTSTMPTVVEEAEESVPTSVILLFDSTGTDEEADIMTDSEEDAEAVEKVGAVPLLTDERKCAEVIRCVERRGIYALGLFSLHVRGLCTYTYRHQIIYARAHHKY